MRGLLTALVATANDALRLVLPALLADCNVELWALETDGLCAWEALKRVRPGILVVDALLPRLDGVTLARRALSTLELPRRPLTLLLYGQPCASATAATWPQLSDEARTDPESSASQLPALEQLGAQVLACPFTADAFCSAIARLIEARPVFPPWEVARTEELLDELGVPAHPGRECLKYAALICAQNEELRFSLMRGVYPAVGALTGLTAAQAERAMRHSIERAWQSDKFENQNRIFENAVDAARGQPTCGEMISRLADILRTEG